MTNEDKQRIEKEAEVYTVSVESRGCSFWQGMYRGYVAGATSEHELLTPQLEYANSTIKKFSAELERSEKLLAKERIRSRESCPAKMICQCGAGGNWDGYCKLNTE